MNRAILVSLTFFSAIFAFAGTDPWAVQPFTQKVFIENKGQFRSESKKILFGASIDGVEIYFKANEIVYRHNELVPMEEAEREKFESPRAKNRKEEEEEGMMKTVPRYATVEWIGSNPDVKVVAEDKVSFFYSYGGYGKKGLGQFTANAFNKITYKNLYPHIDVEYVFPKDSSGMKYAIILHPGATPADIKMKWSEKNPFLNASGDLVVKSEFGNFTDHAPQTFYADGGSIASSFLLDGRTVSFSLASFDPGRTVVIDPWTTSPTFTNNRAFDLDYDNAGNVYVYGSGAGFSNAKPFQLAKISAAGALQWVYSSAAMSTYYNYGDLAVDKVSGNTFLGEGWHSNAGWPNLERVSTGGTQNGMYTFAAPTNSKAVLEIWRLDYDECSQNIVLGTGGLPNSPSNWDNTQVTVMNNALGVVTGPTTAINAMDGVDACMLKTDKYSCCQPFAYVMAAGMAPLTKPYANKLTKVTLPGLAPVWSVPTGHRFGEVMSNLYAGTGNAPSAFNANGYNGIAVSRTYVYTYDSDSLKRWDKASGAFVAAADVAASTPTYNSGFFGGGAIYLSWGGLDVDECDNTYVGVGKDIKVYDINFNLTNTYNLPDTVYDVRLAPNSKLYACGKGFVTEINNTVVTSSTNYNVAVSSTPSSGCSNCNGTASVVTTATVTCGPPPSFEYLWAPGGQTTTSISALCPGTYTVTVTSNCFPVSIQTVAITGGAVVTTTAAANPTTCGQSNGSASVTVTTGTAPYTYSWSPSAGSTSAVSNLAAGDYTVVVTDAGGCTSTQIVNVAPSVNIVAQAGPNSTVCSGQSVNLNASGGTTYLWSNGQTTSSISVTATGTGTYTVIVSDSGCSDTAFATVNVFPSPTVTVTGTTILCIGDATTLTASGGSTYVWNSGASTASISDTPLTNTTYSVLATDANGCTGTAQVAVTVSPPPVATATSDTICSGQSTVLTATGGGNYAWSNGASTSSITVAPATNTNYTVIVSAGSCADTAFSSVLVNPSPSVSLGNVTICAGQSATLDAGNPGASYFWSTGETTQAVNISSVGSYWVIVALSNCLAKDTIEAFTAPEVGLFDSSLCTTSPIILDAGSGATSYFWSTGSTDQTISVDSAGTYWVTVMFGNCASTAVSNIEGMPGGGALYVPNCFTPNTDHLNETFSAVGSGINTFEMEVFDRWGNLIFTSNDINQGWDGKIEGGHYIMKKDGEQVAQQDVYIWKIDYTMECVPKNVRSMMGHVSLVK